MSYLLDSSNLKCRRRELLLLAGYESWTRPGPLSEKVLKKQKQHPDIINTTKPCLWSVCDYGTDWLCTLTASTLIADAEQWHRGINTARIFSVHVTVHTPKERPTTDEPPGGRGAGLTSTTARHQD